MKIKLSIVLLTFSAMRVAIPGVANNRGRQP
jgi:hypothetical protein